MLTRCCICACAIDVDGQDDASAFCRWCARANFGGQKIPDLDVPHIEVVGLGRRRTALARVQARHQEEDDGAG